MASKFEAAAGVIRPLEERIKKCRQIDGKSIQDLATELDMSRPVLSKILSGKQEGNQALISKLESYAESVEAEHPDLYQEEAHYMKRGFVQTKDADSVIGVCSAAQETGGLGVIVGKSGYGKTHALKYYAMMPRVAYIECDSAMGTKDFIVSLEEELGVVSATNMKIWPKLQNLQKYFAMNTGHLLIIDEADKLISSYADKKIEVLRALFDQSHLGIVVAGEPKLKTTLEHHSERFANRVDFYANLKGLTEEEAKQILKSYRIEEAALEVITARACNKKNGCYRLLDRTMDNIGRLMKHRGEDTITLEIIQEASSLMML